MPKPIMSEIVISRYASFLYLLSSALVIFGSIGIVVYIIFIIPYSRRILFSFISIIALGLVIYAILEYIRQSLLSNAYLLSISSIWERRIPEEASETDDIDVQVIGKITDLHGPVHVRIFDETPENFRVVRSGNNWYGEIRPSSIVKLSYRVRPSFGTHYFGALNINAYDNYGLFTVRMHVPLTATIKVLPSIIIDPREIVLNLSSRIPGGLSLTNRPGIGIEYFATRDYFPGDDYRFIDWRATARLRRIMVKEFEEEASLYILMLFLITPRMYKGVRGVTKVEVLSRIISTLSNYLAFRGDMYSLGYIIVSLQPITRFTGYGRGYGHTYFIRSVLSGIPWGAEFFFRDISKEFSLELSRMIRREKTNIIIFTDFNDDIMFAENILSILFTFKKLGHDIMVVIPHTLLYEEEIIELELLKKRRDDLIEPALTLHKIYSVERRDLINRIMELVRGYGFKVVYTSPRDTVFTIIRELELMRRYYGFG